MSELLNNLQDPRTLTSTASLIFTVGGFAYLMSEIQTIKSNIEELRQHMSHIIPMVDPKLKTSLDYLNKRLDLTQKNVDTLSSQLHVNSTGTPTVTLPAYHRKTEPVKKVKLVEPEPIIDDDDLDKTIRAMERT